MSAADDHRDRARLDRSGSRSSPPRSASDVGVRRVVLVHRSSGVDRMRGPPTADSNRRGGGPDCDAEQTRVIEVGSTRADCHGVYAQTACHGKVALRQAIARKSATWDRERIGRQGNYCPAVEGFTRDSARDRPALSSAQRRPFALALRVQAHERCHRDAVEDDRRRDRRERDRDQLLPPVVPDSP